MNGDDDTTEARINPRQKTQEIEADEIISRLKTRRDNAILVPACTPQAHAEVVKTQSDMIDGQIWQIRRMDRADKRSPENVKVGFGPLKISGLRAKQLGGILWKLIVLIFFSSILIHQLGMEVKIRSMLGLPDSPVPVVSPVSPVAAPKGIAKWLGSTELSAPTAKGNAK